MLTARLEPSLDGPPSIAITEALVPAVEATFCRILGEAPTYRGNGGAASVGEAVVGMISFVGRPVWSLALVLPRETAGALATSFAGFRIRFDSSEMGDVVGDLVRLLAGEVDVELRRRGLMAQMSVPTTLRARRLEFLMPEGCPWAQLIFESADGPFWIRLTPAKRCALASVRGENSSQRRFG